jgi:hypothetical protein
MDLHQSFSMQRAEKRETDERQRGREREREEGGERDREVDI